MTNEHEGAARCQPAEADPQDASAQRNGDPLDSLLKQLSAVSEYSLHFVEAKLDGAKVRLRHVLLAALAGVIGLVLATTMAIVSGIYLARGVAGGLAVAVGNRAWLGQLLAGLLGLSVLAAFTWVVMGTARMKRLAEKRTKYELRKARQREEFGRDVEQAAGEPT